MSEYFPVEVIVEILERLPIKSLVKFMCVCKAWKSIVTNHTFIISHQQRLESNPTNSSLSFHIRHHYDDDATDSLSTHMKGRLYSLYSHDDDATDSVSVFKSPPVYASYICNAWRVVGTCNGLVCFALESLSDCSSAVIWNPCILKYLILPEPSLTFTTQRYVVLYGFGFDSQNHDFKLVRFVSPDGETSSQVEIYSLAAHSWRTIAVAPLPFGIATRSENKFVNGVLHWKAHREVNGMADYFILTFDVVEEKFGELMLPQCLEGAQKVWEILKGGNLLALKHDSVSTSEDIFCGTSIWVMKEYGVVESWTELFHLDSIRYNTNMEGVLALRNIQEVVIGSWDDEITFLNPTKGLEKKRHINGFISCVGDHMESLFLINEKKAKAYLPQNHGLRYFILTQQIVYLICGLSILCFPAFLMSWFLR